MAQRLTDLVVTEASLVDNPANPHARVLLWKRDDGVTKGDAVDSMAEGIDPAELEDICHKRKTTWNKTGREITEAQRRVACAAMSKRAMDIDKAEPCASDTHVNAPMGAMKPKKPKKDGAMIDKAGNGNDNMEEGTTRVEPNEEATVDASTERGGSTSATQERGGGAEPEANDEATSYADITDYDSEYDVGVKKEPEGTWYLVNAQGDHVTGPYANKIAAQAALRAHCGYDIATKSLDVADDIFKQALAKKGAKISGDRLKRLKLTHQMLGGMINEQDGSYHPGGDTMTDEQRSAAESGDDTGKEEATGGEKTEPKKEKDMEKKDTAPVVEKAAEVTKAAEPDMLERVTKLEAGLVEANKRADAAETIAKHERDLRETMEFTALAKSDLAGAPGDIDTKVTKLKKVYATMSKEDADAFVEDWKAMAKTVRESALFREHGASGGSAGGPAGTDAASRLQALATQKMAEVNKTAVGKEALTFAKAYDMVLKENPALYAQYKEESRDRASRIH